MAAAIELGEGPPMAAATFDGWKDVPDSLLLKIAVRVPCEADRMAMARVCRLWGAALARLADQAPLPLPPQLPWLLLLLPGGPVFSCVHRDDDPTGFHRSDRSTGFHRGDGLTGFHHGDRSTGFHRGDRSTRFHRGDGSTSTGFFGSYDGRWLFVATGDTIGTVHLILNIRDARSYLLPREFHLEVSFSRPRQPEANRFFMMLVAALSTAPNEDRCIGAAIIRCSPFDNRSPRQITFWQMGDKLAMTPYDIMFGQPEDVIWFKGDFYFLVAGDSGEHLFVCSPSYTQNGVLTAVKKGLRFVQPHNVRAYEQQPHVRYLVVSRGELMMVVKSPDEPWQFMVFEMTQIHTADPGHMLYRWKFVPDLDGRILFVGKGCSRSYEMKDFPGFHSGIYFMDDLHKSNLDISKEDKEFPCINNGFWLWWRMLPKTERCFRLDQDKSASSPPVWILS